MSLLLAGLNRGLHPVLKKKSGKQASGLFDDDPFAEDTIEDDLFSSKVPDTATQAIEKGTGTSTQRTLQDPSALFDSKYRFLQQYIMKPPPPQIRDNSLDFLLLYTRTETQLFQFIEFLPRWRESGRVVHPRTVLALIGV